MVAEWCVIELASGKPFSYFQFSPDFQECGILPNCFFTVSFAKRRWRDSRLSFTDRRLQTGLVFLTSAVEYLGVLVGDDADNLDAV